ncbi:ribosomal protein S6 kinase-related protein isoform 2-T2 [Morphnus guianensis]
MPSYRDRRPSYRLSLHAVPGPCASYRRPPTVPPGPFLPPGGVPVPRVESLCDLMGSPRTLMGSPGVLPGSRVSYRGPVPPASIHNRPAGVPVSLSPVPMCPILGPHASHWGPYWVLLVPMCPHRLPWVPCATSPHAGPHTLPHPEHPGPISVGCSAPAPPNPPQILGFVAKGSFGTILKVLDCGREKVCAVKVGAAPGARECSRLPSAPPRQPLAPPQVVPKVEVLRRDTLKQCKEEVSIQRQVRHPFVHGLGDSWQGQRHLFIMCTYCSTGDLHALWRAAGHFAEATVRLFAAELVLVLVYLHDLGIMHRDVKMENILLDERGHLKLTDFGLSRHLRWGERAHTICGTLQYMAPEVLSGGPYSHTADWWSLGVLLFALASGEFPVAPAGDHMAMLERVKESSYAIPPAFSPALARLLAELLCHNPLRRLRYLHHFQGHPFFRGVAFDADLLQKDPVVMAVAPRPLEQPPPDPATFADFDCDLAISPGRPWPG